MENFTIVEEEPKVNFRIITENVLKEQVVKDVRQIYGDREKNLTGKDIEEGLGGFAWR